MGNRVVRKSLEVAAVVEDVVFAGRCRSVRRT